MLTPAIRQSIEESIEEAKGRPTQLLSILVGTLLRYPKTCLTKAALGKLEFSRRDSQCRAWLEESHQDIQHRSCELGRCEELEHCATHGGSGPRSPPSLEDILSRLMELDRHATQSTPSLTSEGVEFAAISETKRAIAYRYTFQQNLIDHGVYPYAYEAPDGGRSAKPDNWKEINERLAEPRDSLSPSSFTDDAFEKFAREAANEYHKHSVLASVIPTIEGATSSTAYSGREGSFANLAPLTDGSLVPGKPDRFDGARSEQLDRSIRNQLNDLIIPSTDDSLPMAPNFFLEAKGPDDSAAIARIQACYDGALGARGIQSLQSYGQDIPVYDNKAYTIMATYHDGTLKLYTSHPTQPTCLGNHPKYIMTQIKGWSLTSDPESFRQGATAYRNARDWAKEIRDAFINAANQRLPGVHTQPQPCAASEEAEICSSSAGSVAVECGTSSGTMVAEDAGTADQEEKDPMGAERSRAKRRRVDDEGR
ncbi:conserved hypothetical protein [Histoplasma capsulatum var. duboisii H88]|uniref:Uncharacterized protein n=2 Tax=Ajellomyces capsulatus (strain H88) TaxID=544711 RepID=F0UJW8_AJEC8|nr:conserved hypothetical protein [Histoplasma capsulatum var. duboisii H88]